MINTQLLILLLITTSIVIISTISIKKITILEGIISIAICNVVSILLWTVNVNNVITDSYNVYHKIMSIEVEVVKDQTDYTHNWYVYTKDEKHKIYSKESSLNMVRLPDKITEKYKENTMFVTTKIYRNVYSNLGQYDQRFFDEKRNVSKLYYNLIDEQIYNEDRVNDDLLNIALNKQTVFIVYIGDDTVSTYDILNELGGLKLNEVLIYLHYDGEVLTLEDITTWGNGVDNELFIKIFKQKAYSKSYNNLDFLMETINNTKKLYKLPDDNSFDINIQNIKPSAILILMIMITSLLITFMILYAMYRYDQSHEDI